MIAAFQSALAALLIPARAALDRRRVPWSSSLAIALPSSSSSVGGAVGRAAVAGVLTRGALHVGQLHKADQRRSSSVCGCSARCNWESVCRREYGMGREMFAMPSASLLPPQSEAIPPTPPAACGNFRLWHRDREQPPMMESQQPRKIATCSMLEVLLQHRPRQRPLRSPLSVHGNTHCCRREVARRQM